MREVVKIADVSFNLMTTSIDATTWRLMYRDGIREAKYPVPAIPLRAVWPAQGYVDLLYLDDMTDPDDPVMVCCWDFYCNTPPQWVGVYQRCYNDAQVSWYIAHGAWDHPAWNVELI